MFLEMIAIFILTRINKEIFNKYNGNQYFLAMKELTNVNPLHAKMINMLIAAALLEWVAIVIYKYYFNNTSI